MNAMLTRYNAAGLHPGCESVDSLHLSDAEWRRENNYCNPPWPLLPDRVQKLRQSGAAATVVALAGRARCGTMHLPRWQWRSAWYGLAAIFSGRGGGQGAICPERRAGQ
eukprot:jgi/Tetstr1/441525/TSEL_029755.t1